MSDSNPISAVSNSEIAAILSAFARHLVCWRVGLQYGSRIYFDMGERWSERIKGDLSGAIGSSNLVLEGYRWTISKQGHELVNSEKVSPRIVDDQLQDVFVGERLERLEFIKTKQELVAKFTGGIAIHSPASLRDEYIDDCLCIFLLPDGRVLSCSPKAGFYADGSICQEHARRFALLDH